jgi:hypothetical protein
VAAPSAVRKRRRVNVEAIAEPYTIQGSFLTILAPRSGQTKGFGRGYANVHLWRNPRIRASHPSYAFDSSKISVPSVSTARNSREAGCLRFCTAVRRSTPSETRARKCRPGLLVVPGLRGSDAARDSARGYLPIAEGTCCELRPNGVLSGSTFHALP